MSERAGFRLRGDVSQPEPPRFNITIPRNWSSAMRDRVEKLMRQIVEDAQQGHNDDEASGELKLWRNWAPFVWAAPEDATDDEMRAAICAKFDAQAELLTQVAAALRDRSLSHGAARMVALTYLDGLAEITDADIAWAKREIAGRDE